MTEAERLLREAYSIDPATTIALLTGKPLPQCADCGGLASPRAGTVGPQRKRCEQCQIDFEADRLARRRVSERRKAAAARLSRPPVECIDCETPMPGAHISTKRCKPCDAARRREAERRRWASKTVEERYAIRRAKRLKHKMGPKARAAKRADQQRRRLLKVYGIECAVTDAELAKIYAMPCRACGTTKGVTADHNIPASRGGRHTIGNLAPMCMSCNASKHNLTWTEWRYSNRPRALEVFGPSSRSVTAAAA